MLKFRNLLCALLVCVLTISCGFVTAEEKPVTLTVMMHGINQMSGVQDDPVTKAIEERLGITIDVISDSGMDLDMQLNSMIASDDLPDIVIAMTPEQRSLLLESEATFLWTIW